MFINTGARNLLLQGERQKFLAEDWPKIRATIQRLGLEPAALDPVSDGPVGDDRRGSFGPPGPGGQGMDHTPGGPGSATGTVSASSTPDEYSGSRNPKASPTRTHPSPATFVAR